MEKFFIVGCPRSGTTLVQQALNRHSRIVIPPETKYFFSFFGHPRRCQARHLERINRDLGIALPRPAARVCTVEEGRAWYEDLARQYVDRLGKKGVTSFGEKTPEHTGLIPRIRELFPESRVVVVYRDGRDVAASLTRVPWMSPNLYVNFLVWLYYDRVVREQWRQGTPRLYLARYEDVVRDPERELAAILRFLGLGYEPAVAQGWGNREGVPERELAWKRQALEPITTERVSAFRRELSDAQIGVLERLGGETLAALGYPLVSAERPALPLSFFPRLACDLGRLAWRLPWRAILAEVGCRLLAPSRPSPSLEPCDHLAPPACAWGCWP